MSENQNNTQAEAQEEEIHLTLTPEETKEEQAEQLSALEEKKEAATPEALDMSRLSRLRTLPGRLILRNRILFCSMAVRPRRKLPISVIRL